ncbi:putative F-box domain-containing protein [Helianthus annuus]|uniref:F-box domain-containing protein n=1 Tax=Helianthus annuus TaxID=4232 RepID=A0A9K3INX1_HELAN|nr:F-box protein At5g07610-like [Helianthus annuus]KAF5800343.1 putative F-box domain-containing protein [Helianthus annuus]
MKTNITQYLKSKKPTSDDDDTNDQTSLSLSSTDLASHDDVLTEILLRLPIRSLLRSKCVSKHWKLLISDSRFALARNPNPNPPSGLFLQRFGNVSCPEYEFVCFDRDKNVKPPFKRLNYDGYLSNLSNLSNSSSSKNSTHSGVIVLQSCNGLMLCYSLNEYFCNVTKDIEYNASYYVYNPTINQVVKLPNLHGCDWIRRRPRGMTLVFDPVKSGCYKVVCVRAHLWSDHVYTIEVYSSETGKWRMFGTPCGNQVDTEFMGGVYWNGAVHWVNKKGYVLYLKIDEDRVDRVATPVVHDGWNVKKHCYPIVESNDCLLFIDIFPASSLKLDIYEMNRDYSGWSVKYHVDLNRVMSRFPETDVIIRALRSLMSAQPFVIHCFVEGEGEDEAFLVLEIPGKAVRYNIFSKTYQELCDLDVSKPSRLSVADDGFSKLGRWPGAFLFFESLSNV